MLYNGCAGEVVVTVSTRCIHETYVLYVVQTAEYTVTLTLKH